MSDGSWKCLMKSYFLIRHLSTFIVMLETASHRLLIKKLCGNAWTPPLGTLVSCLQMGHVNVLILHVFFTCSVKHCRQNECKQGSDRGSWYLSIQMIHVRKLSSIISPGTNPPVAILTYTWGPPISFSLSNLCPVVLTCQCCGNFQILFYF